MASLVTPLTPVPAGGAQAFLADLAAELAARGHDVTVYCAQGSAVPGVRLMAEPVPAGVARALVRPGGAPPASPPGLRGAFERQWRAIRRGGHDAVSQHAFDAAAIELAAGLPVLHTLHLPPLLPDVVAAVAAAVERSVTVSEHCAREWAGVGVAAGVIRNGVRDFSVEPTTVRPLALVAGRVSPEKGTAVAIRVALAAGLEPVLAGAIYDRPYWAAEVRLPVRPLPRRGLWQLMAGAAVTLMPVLWDEPFGLVAAESQLAGCPVAGYRRGGLPEVVEEGVGGHLVDPGDEAALTAAARRALALDRGVVAARARARFGFERVAADYEAALALVAG